MKRKKKESATAHAVLAIDRAMSSAQPRVTLTWQAWSELVRIALDEADPPQECSGGGCRVKSKKDVRPAQ